MIRVIELFAGIGAQAQALKEAKVDHELVAVSEIDESAYKVYQALHGNVPNLGDITKIEYLPDADLWTYSFPCTNISLAGKLAGLSEGSGTASSLIWEVSRLLNNAETIGNLPKYLLMENVSNLVSKTFMPEFEKWLNFLTKLGYESKWKVLNAKDFGVPQSRKRVFMLSVLGKNNYEWPKEKPLTLCLADLLDEEVEDKYYLSDRAIAGIFKSNFQQKMGQIVNKEGICPTLLGRDYKDPKCVVQEPKLKELSEHQSQGNRVYDSKGLACTQKAQGGGMGAKTGLYLVDKTICLNPKGGRANDPNAQPSVQDRVYDTKGIAPAITCSFNPKIAALRGRKEDDGQNHQHLEIREDDLTNTIITVEKDNVILIPQKTKLGYAIAEVGDGIYTNRCESKRGVVQKGMIPTLKAGSSDIGVVVEKRTSTLKTELCNKVLESKELKPYSVIRHSYTSNRIKDEKLTSRIENTDTKLFPTIDTRCDCLGIAVPDWLGSLAIRRLTPRESWRLMGWKDQESEPAFQIGMSNAKLYKMAGNSIVVAVLKDIFTNLEWLDLEG